MKIRVNSKGMVDLSTARILIAADTALSRDSLKRILQPMYQVTVAASATDALELLASPQFDLVVLDLRTAEGNGLDVIRTVRRNRVGPKLPVLIAIGAGDTRYLVEALETGATDYVAKPFEVPVLLARIQTQLARKRTEDSLYQACEQLEYMLSERTAELSEIARQLERESARREFLETELHRMIAQADAARVSSIDALKLAIEKRDPSTAGHQHRVAELATAIGKEMGLEGNSIRGLQVGATFHDMGKIGIPGDILNRPGKLNSVEYNFVKTHPQTGYEIMRNVAFPWPVGEMVIQHHERLDGSGYPRRLGGNEILPEARIIAVADVIESMTAHRPYSAAIAMDAALQEIEMNRGVLYDPDVAEACMKVVKDRGFIFGA